MASNSHSPERSFGDYELLEEIGRGGMGVIWKARQVSLGRLVALKMIRDSQLASPKAHERFRVEAEAAGRLHHPNIVPIYEFGAVEGTPFISMLLVEGSDLVRWTRGIPMEARPLARLMAKLAQAIQFAHQRGILHLDLKPANVLMDAQGEPHLTDFGLARRLDAQEVSAFPSEVVGSPNYMAPEQVSGRSEELTTATDVYSLGAIMYELLSGRAPFRSESPLATLRKMQEEEPEAPRSLYKFADPELETVCLKCLEKRPDRRYASASALAADLERWLHHEPLEARPITVRERLGKWARRNPGITALLVLVHVVLSLGLGGIVWMGARASARARESHDRLIRTYVTGGNQWIEAHEDFTALLWFVEALRLEDQGPIAEENHRYRIGAVLNRASMLQQAFFNKDHIRAANFDGDGRRLIIGTSAGTAAIWDVATGRQLTPDLKMPASVHRVRFNRDGKKVLSMDIAGYARIWDAATGTPLTPLLRGDDYSGDARILEVTNGAPILPVLQGPDSNDEPFDWAFLKLDPSGWFSPDGTKLLTAWGCRSAHLWDVTTGKHIRAFSHHSQVVSAKFSPDGKYIVTGGNDNTARLWDAQTGQQLGKPLVHDKFVTWAGFHPDGHRLLTVSDRRQIHVWDWKTGQELLPPLSHGEVLFAAAFSPDGRKILSGGWDKTARIWDTATGLEVSRFSLPGGVVSAAWSPDGRSIATACEDGTARIWDATGTGKLLAALPHGAGDFYLSYSSSGRRLVTFGFTGTARVWDVTQTDNPALEIKHPHSGWAEFNADGGKVVSAGFWPANDVRVFNAATGAPESPVMPHTNAVRRARFSPDGRRILTASDDFTARIWDVTSGRELIPTLCHPAAVLDGMFSPDGRTIATACSDGNGRLWEATTGRLLGTLPHAKKVTSILFSPDGRLVATASDDATARLWDTASGQPVTPPLTHRGRVTSIRFSRASTHLLTGSQAPDGEKGAAQMWDVKTGSPLGEPLEHDDDVNDAEYSPDERFIVTASQDHTARVWDVHTHRPVTLPMRHLDGLLEASFSPDSHRVVTLALEGDVRLWDALTGEAITPTLPHRHSYNLGHVAFSPRASGPVNPITATNSFGDRLLIAVGGDGPVLRDFNPATQPLPALINQAELLTGHRLDPTAGTIRLDPETLSNHWRQLSATAH
ncbi:MAG TPA: protein kinase [Candidatus Limnocylindria bacterium]|nr:protein kinase [Candidatus Limnocylindria bacterium]